MKARMSSTLEEILKNSTSRESLRSGLQCRAGYFANKNTNKPQIKTSDKSYTVQLVNRKG